MIHTCKYTHKKSYSMHQILYELFISVHFQICVPSMGLHLLWVSSMRGGLYLFVYWLIVMICKDFHLHLMNLRGKKKNWVKVCVKLFHVIAVLWPVDGTISSKEAVLEITHFFFKYWKKNAWVVLLFSKTWHVNSLALHNSTVMWICVWKGHSCYSATQVYTPQQIQCLMTQTHLICGTADRHINVSCIITTIN